MTFVMAVGTTLLLPAMILAAALGVPAGERARVVATFTMSMDVAAAIGPGGLGVVAAGAGYGSTFVVAGGVALVGLVLLRLWLRPPQHPPAEVVIP